MACGLIHSGAPDVVHAHDWHATGARLSGGARGRPAKSVLPYNNRPACWHVLCKAWMTSEPVVVILIKGRSTTTLAPLFVCHLYYGGEPDLCVKLPNRSLLMVWKVMRQRHLEGRLSGILNGG
ncbi:hypothetical protein KCP70_09370 [Salmonella enterica subsp. enterica]|nr:hypothetical protein KCP70_09370 [Salmonella enterica subsp. enterica]